jgi:hypothetical protein
VTYGETERRILRVGCAVIVVALVGAVVMQAVLASAQRGSASTGCIARQQQLLANGRSPSGSSWTIRASISNNGSCHAWLLGMAFAPFGTPVGSWSGAWRVPVGGQLADTFTIGAQDESSGSERVFSGIVGRRVRDISLIRSEGSKMVVHPRLPPQELRQRFGWLRNMRYFMRYYSVGDNVTTVKLRNYRGEVIYTAQGEEGGFHGPL